MKVNLEHLPVDAAPQELCAELDLSGLRRWGRSPVTKPVAVRAQLQRKTGSYLLRYTADYTLQTVCSRCLEAVESAGRLEMEHILIEKLEGERANDSFILVPGSVLELEELVLADLSLELSDVPLCSENCKGLCSKCGANHNHAACDCPEKEPDARFAVLRKLLDQEG